MNNLVEIVNLTKKYGANVAVNNLTVSLPKGKIIGLLGPNGSGKTTLIKMLNGLLTPTEGTIMIDGNYVGPATKSKVAYLPDRTYLTMNQTIREILYFFQDFYTDFSRERAEEMLKSLGIDPAVKMRTLSKGTKEKVQLILVMSRNASLYILDEPIAGVDPAARDYILRTIINNYNPEATVLISTHLIEDVEQVLDEVIFMRYGQLVLYTSVDNIREEKGKSVDAYFREVFACWSFRNGYKPHSIESSGGNGAGFKSGGYGMGDIKKVPNPIPQHTVRYCLAYYNRQQGFYSNHHLGGLIFENNTAYKNPSNYNMLNRKSSNEAVDVPGYGHIIKNNLSLSPRNSGGFPQHLINVDNTLSEIKNNSFAPNDLNLSESDFESLNEQELMGSRKSDGSLPDINFLRLTNHANFRFSGMGCFINEEAVDYSWIQEPAIVLENGVARIVGEDSKSFNKFYVNGEEVSIENGIVDLTSMSGELNLKAISENGAVTTLIINK